MKRITLNKTDLVVSSLCLGTANFGTSINQKDCFRQLYFFEEQDGNFIDTAHVYGDWAGTETGLSEKTIGKWMKESGRRNQTVLCSKGCHPPIEDMKHSRVDKKSLKEDVRGSLRNLQTDYVDLYFLHRDNTETPVSELLETLEEEVKTGNIRYYGCSNWSLKRAGEAQEYARRDCLKGFVCNQMMYTLMDVVEETLTEDQLTILDYDFFRYHMETGLNLMAYMCMAGGYLNKRLMGKPVSAAHAKRYESEGNEAIIRYISENLGKDYQILDYMFSYITQTDFPAVPIASFSDEFQLKEAVESIDRIIPKAMRNELTDCKQLQKYL